MRAQRIDVEFTEEAVRLLAEEGFDPSARPLRRTIQRQVENELSRLVLSGGVQPGDKIVVSVAGDDLHLDVETGGAAELLDAEEERQEEPAGAPA